MKTALLVISILLIIIVLLQSSKSEDGAQIISGRAEMFVKRKERGSELVISRITFLLGLAFFTICLVAMFI